MIPFNQRGPIPRLTALSAWLVWAASASAAEFTYDAARRLVGVDYGGGKVIAYRYDKNGNLLGRDSVVATTADLRIVKSANTVSITGGVNFDYTITVTNDGPDPATQVSVTDLFPGGLLVTSAIISQGSFTLGGQTLECDFGVLAAGASASIGLRVLHTLEGTFTNTATVSADQADPDLANNTSSDTTTGTAANDDDNDGMPNWWEEQHGMSAFSSSRLNGPDGDRDRDGVRNFDEWLADTDPNDPDSFLHISFVGLDAGGEVSLTLDSSPIRDYSLESSPDLASPFTPIETRRGTGGELSFLDPNPPAGRGYYRISVAIAAP